MNILSAIASIKKDNSLFKSVYGDLYQEGFLPQSLHSPSGVVSPVKP